MPLRTDADKALRQITRRDADNVARYRAELKYFHVRQRVILGFTNVYEVLDEAFTLTPSQMATLDKAMSHGPTPQRVGLPHGPGIAPHPHPHALPPT